MYMAMYGQWPKNIPALIRDIHLCPPLAVRLELDNDKPRLSSPHIMLKNTILQAFSSFTCEIKNFLTIRDLRRIHNTIDCITACIIAVI
jgi:hypothetical protein